MIEALPKCDRVGGRTVRKQNRPFQHFAAKAIDEPVVTGAAKVNRLLFEGLASTAVAKTLGIDRSSVYPYVEDPSNEDRELQKPSD